MAENILLEDLENGTALVRGRKSAIETNRLLAIAMNLWVCWKTLGLTWVGHLRISSLRQTY